MGIITRLVAGPATRPLAMRIPGRRSQGPAITACHLVSGQDRHEMGHR